MQGFNDIAGIYDQTFTHTRIGKAQRNIVWRYLLRDLPDPPASILEMNGGTGTDALFLLQQGYTVTATDGAANMVSEIKKKIAGQTNGKALVWDLHGPLPLGDAKYAVGFSNFGGWNCLHTEALQQLGLQLRDHLPENGKLIVVVMGRKCLWERFYFLWKGDKHNRKRRRSKNAVPANTGSGLLPVYYYAPKELAACLHPYFTVRTIRPVGICIPPSYMEKGMKKIPLLLSLCIVLEKFFGLFPFLSNQADHYYMLLEKNKSEAHIR
ncbi:MAG: methyltransferase domain-containing protein [Chitinophagales bacterium]